jgi:hypothetical protein
MLGMTRLREAIDQERAREEEAEREHADLYEKARLGYARLHGMGRDG